MVDKQDEVKPTEKELLQMILDKLVSLEVVMNQNNNLLSQLVVGLTPFKGDK